MCVGLTPLSLSRHERVLEAITEEAETLDMERFEPLLSGMGKPNFPLKVHTHTHTHILSHTFSTHTRTCSLFLFLSLSYMQTVSLFLTLSPKHTPLPVLYLHVSQTHAPPRTVPVCAALTGRVCYREAACS